MLVHDLRSHPDRTHETSPSHHRRSARPVRFRAATLRIGGGHRAHQLAGRPGARCAGACRVHPARGRRRAGVWVRWLATRRRTHGPPRRPCGPEDDGRLVPEDGSRMPTRRTTRRMRPADSSGRITTRRSRTYQASGRASRQFPRRSWSSAHSRPSLESPDSGAGTFPANPTQRCGLDVSPSEPLLFEPVASPTAFFSGRGRRRARGVLHGPVELPRRFTFVFLVPSIDLLRGAAAST